MNYTDNECPVCHRKFQDGDDIVVCPNCGTPHHRSCWQQEGICANSQLHGSFEWQNTAASHRKPEEHEPGRGEQHSHNVKCRNCGGINFEGSDRCEYCGAPLYGGQRNTYDSPFHLNVDIVPPNTLIDGIPAEEEAAYIGPESTKYILRSIDMDRRESKLSWNWGAAIFGPLWCFYRKMYGAGLLYILVSLVISVICIPKGMGDFINGMRLLITQTQDYGTLMDYIMNNMPAMSYRQELLQSGFRAAAAVVMGLFGNYFYRVKTRNSILNIRTKANDMNTYMFLLRKKGGVGILMPILLMLLAIYAQGFVIMGFAGLLSL